MRDSPQHAAKRPSRDCDDTAPRTAALPRRGLRNAAGPRLVSAALRRPRPQPVAFPRPRQPRPALHVGARRRPPLLGGTPPVPDAAAPPAPVSRPPGLPRPADELRHPRPRSVHAPSCACGIRGRSRAASGAATPLRAEQLERRRPHRTSPSARRGGAAPPPLAPDRGARGHPLGASPPSRGKPAMRPRALRGARRSCGPLLGGAVPLSPLPRWRPDLLRPLLPDAGVRRRPALAGASPPHGQLRLGNPPIPFFQSPLPRPRAASAPLPCSEPLCAATFPPLRPGGRAFRGTGSRRPPPPWPRSQPSAVGAPPQRRSGPRPPPPQ
mmetsp:Transcript_48079/g.140100  ORF Transcript_48079/g.140100 Transcript_48079/m.140100 type:complete len:325 (+) Transcript_48079:308-1282(+)